MLRAYLERIPDPRRKQGRLYKLHDILLVSILALLSGARSYRDIARFAKVRFKELTSWFRLFWERAPSRSSIQGILCGVERDAVEAAFRAYSRALSELNKDSVQGLALDGKALKGSFDYGKDHALLQLVSAFCTHTQLILGHVEIPDKTNEIPVAQAMIRDLRLPEGTIYTLDAMHCQKKRLRRLRRRKVS